MKIGNQNRSDIIAPAIIFTAAFILRLVFLLQFSKTPLFLPLLSELDDAFYDRWALTIAQGNWLGNDVFHGMPLYPYFLSIIYMLFGHSVFVAKLCQIIIGAATCVLIYFIGRKAFNKATGILAGLLFAFYGMSLFYEGLLVASALTLWINAAAMLLLITAPDSPGYKRWILAGAAVGLSALAMAGALLFLPLAALSAFLLLRQRGRDAGSVSSCRAAHAAGASLMLTALLVIAPVTLRNYIVAREFVFITAHGGLNFYIGNNPDADGTFSPPPGMNPSADKMIIQSRAVAEQAMGRELTSAEVSGWWRHKAFQSVCENPGGHIRLLARKFLLFCNAREIYDVMDYSFVQDRVPVLRLPLLNFGIIGPLGLMGIMLSFPLSRRRRALYLLYAFIAAHTCSILMFFVNSRYRLPVTPYFAIFSAYTLVWWFDKARRRQYRPVVLSVVALIFLFCVAHIKMFTIDQAASHNNLGDIYRRKGLYGEAIKEFQEALRLNPDIQEVRSNLGSVYWAMGLHEQALAEYLKARELRPNYDAIYFDLGNVYYAMGRFPEAAESFHATIRLNPKHGAAYNNLACVYMREGRYEEAKLEVRKALAIYPDYEDARANLRRLNEL